MHLCAEPSMSLCPTFILMGMPYFVPVPSPPEAHEGTVGDQTLRDIKVGAMGEGAGENGKSPRDQSPEGCGRAIA